MLFPSSQHELTATEKVSLLQSLSIFDETPVTILTDLAPLMEQLEVAAGTDVFKEDETGESMYIIASGSIHIHRRSTTLAVLHQHQVFGELSLLDAEKRSATATAKVNCLLFKIDQEPFYQLIDARPEVARGFIKILCSRLRVLNEKTVYNSL
jgi:CRP/FNR family cyclic AMP-dependent transcriptional regulator